MNAIILSIGDELILGQTIDTNSGWLSRQLAGVGCEITAHATVPDDQKLIEQAIWFAARRADFVIISGGIGPTEDDLTRQALASVMGVGLALSETWLRRLEEFFRQRGREMPHSNQIQAMIPHGAKIIENTCGTAAGIDAEYDPNAKYRDTLLSLPDLGKNQSARDEYIERLFGKQSFGEKLVREGKMRQMPSRVFVMPGVPKEMKAMFTRDVLPHIQKSTGGAVILSATLHTFGLGESWAAEKLGNLMNRSRNPSVGTTVSHGIVSLRINARFGSREEAQEKLDDTVRACREALGDIIYGEEEQTLAQVVAEMLIRKSQIENRKFTVTTAESCTGGLLAKMLTDIPGSSDYFKTGFVTYSNEAKHDLLGVPMELINHHGAVSERVVEAMANGARTRAGADFALAISGVAGPSGGTPDKPVGTVCIGLAHTTGVTSRTFLFSGDREMIRDRSAKMALTILRFNFLGLAMPF